MGRTEGGRGNLPTDEAGAPGETATVVVGGAGEGEVDAAPARAARTSCCTKRRTESNDGEAVPGDVVGKESAVEDDGGRSATGEAIVDKLGKRLDRYMLLQAHASCQLKTPNGTTRLRADLAMRMRGPAP